MQATGYAEGQAARRQMNWMHVDHVLVVYAYGLGAPSDEGAGIKASPGCRRVDSVTATAVWAHRGKGMMGRAVQTKLRPS